MGQAVELVDELVDVAVGGVELVLEGGCEGAQVLRWPIRTRSATATATLVVPLRFLAWQPTVTTWRTGRRTAGSAVMLALTEVDY